MNYNSYHNDNNENNTKQQRILDRDKEPQGEAETGAETERERDRQTDRQRGREGEKERERDRQTDRQTETDSLGNMPSLLLLWTDGWVHLLHTVGLLQSHHWCVWNNIASHCRMVLPTTPTMIIRITIIFTIMTNRIFHYNDAINHYFQHDDNGH